MDIFIFVIGVSLLILIHEVGHFIAAKSFGLFVHEFGFGFPPRLFARRIGETTYSFNLLPFGGFVKIHGEQREETGENGIPRARNFAYQSFFRRAVILSAGVCMNFLMGWLIISALYWVGVPSAVVVTDIVLNAPAAAAGLTRGDVFVDFTTGAAFTEFIARSAGTEVELRVRRDGALQTVRLTPRENPPAGEGRIGVAFLETGVPRKGLFAGLFEGLKFSLKVVGMVFQSIANLIRGIFTSAPALENLVGPVGIFKVAADSARFGFTSLIQFIGLISLNLAVLNILPFPALDGGRLFFLAIEKMKGSPLSPKREAIANIIGFSLLILLMVVITVRDVAKLFL